MKTLTIDGIMPVKKILKEGRKEKRDNRKAGEMSPLQHIWYALFWQLFVPNNGTVAWTLLTVAVTYMVVKGFRG